MLAVNIELLLQREMQKIWERKTSRRTDSGERYRWRLADRLLVKERARTEKRYGKLKGT